MSNPIYCAIVFFGLIVAPSWGTIAAATGTKCDTNSSVASKACSIGTISSGTLIIVGAMVGGTFSTVTIADDIDGAYTQAGTNSTSGGTSAGLWYKVSSGGGTRTVTGTLTSGTGLISWISITVTGQAASAFIHETLKGIGTSSATCGAFTRSGNEVIVGFAATEGGSINGVAWTNAGSTGTFTTASQQANANCCTATTSVYQVITSGTTYNWIVGITPVDAVVCNAVSVRENAPSTAMHKVSQ